MRRAAELVSAADEWDCRCVAPAPAANGHAVQSDAHRRRGPLRFAGVPERTERVAARWFGGRPWRCSGADPCRTRQHCGGIAGSRRVAARHHETDDIAGRPRTPQAGVRGDRQPFARRVPGRHRPAGRRTAAARTDGADRCRGSDRLTGPAPADIRDEGLVRPGHRLAGRDDRRKRDRAVRARPDRRIARRQLHGRSRTAARGCRGTGRSRAEQSRHAAARGRIRHGRGVQDHGLYRRPRLSHRGVSGDRPALPRAFIRCPPA